ncbi:MAG: DMT family transporter [Acidobacteria bacterium]|nr:DMT family transporter [Acidobacteriota bacterium]MBV9148114.1 DMT family transporter [Acidobacteriota bacterium]
MPRALKAHVLLVLVTFVWGATFVVIKNAVAQDATPLLFNFIRMTLATLALGTLFYRDIARIRRPALVAGVLTGLWLWLGYEFQTTGIRLTTASKSAFITGISVILVPLFLILFWGRKIGLWTALGVLAAMVGLFLLTVPAGEGAWANWASVNRGDLLTLACAVSFGFQIIFLGRATEKYPFAQIGFLQVATAAVLMGIAAPILERPHIVWTSRVGWAIVITGILGTAAAFTIQAWAQQFTSPTHTALIFSLEPVFAWITSYFVLGERLGYRAGAGALLILAGVLISELLGSAANAAKEERGLLQQAKT